MAGDPLLARPRLLAADRVRRAARVRPHLERRSLDSPLPPGAPGATHLRPCVGDCRSRPRPPSARVDGLRLRARLCRAAGPLFPARAARAAAPARGLVEPRSEE